MSEPATADEAVLETLAAAMSEMLDALETLAGKVDLEGEAVYVRANLDKASALLAGARCETN